MSTPRLRALIRHARHAPALPAALVALVLALVCAVAFAVPLLVRASSSEQVAGQVAERIQVTTAAALVNVAHGTVTGAPADEHDVTAAPILACPESSSDSEDEDGEDRQERDDGSPDATGLVHHAYELGASLSGRALWMEASSPAMCVHLDRVPRPPST